MNDKPSHEWFVPMVQPSSVAENLRYYAEREFTEGGCQWCALMDAATNIEELIGALIDARNGALRSGIQSLGEKIDDQLRRLT
jgi:hypothetical protein